MGKTIITYGSYDLIHLGHINLLQRAKELGDKLIVGLSTDDFNSIKHKESFFDYQHRKKILEAIRYVDLVIPENNWDQKQKDIKKHNVNVFVMGSDWEGHFDYLKEHCEVVYFSRTKDISTTNLKSKISKKVLSRNNKTNSKSSNE